MLGFSSSSRRYHRNPVLIMEGINFSRSGTRRLDLFRAQGFRNVFGFRALGHFGLKVLGFGLCGT